MSRLQQKRYNMKVVRTNLFHSSITQIPFDTKYDKIIDYKFKTHERLFLIQIKGRTESFNT